MSPLFTVLAYRFIYGIHYSPATYLSLVPLTVGVVLACSVEFSGNFFGILCAFGGALVFVSQNIFSKKLFNESAGLEADGFPKRKLDKLNLLCYSSGIAFCLTVPLWLWSEGFTLLGDFIHDGALDTSGKKGALTSGRLALEFLFNGTFHFGQNIMAFILLSMISPVTYSVASLIKRVFVIVVAIVWFGNKTTPVQAVGIALTFLGLYLYDRISDAAKADRRAIVNQMKSAPLLPLRTDHYSSNSQSAITFSPSPMTGATSGQAFGGLNGSANGEEKKADASGPGMHGGRDRTTSMSGTGWLPPGTRQEETWRPREMLA